MNSDGLTRDRLNSLSLKYQGFTDLEISKLEFVARAKLLRRKLNINLYPPPGPDPNPRVRVSPPLHYPRNT